MMDEGNEKEEAQETEEKKLNCQETKWGLNLGMFFAAALGFRAVEKKEENTYLRLEDLSRTTSLHV